MQTGIPSLSYVGVTAATPPEFIQKNKAPTSRDYDNFRIGTLWLDYSSMSSYPPVAPVNEDIYMLVAKRNNVATWLPLGAVTSATLTGDSGGAVSVDGSNNINVLGTASRITTTGNPGTSTITWDVDATIADTYSTDSGNAIPLANVLNIVGDGSDISTSGATNVVTVSFDGTAYATQFTTDSGSAIPVANNVNILGGTSISTSGAGSTVTVSADTTVATTYTADSGSATPVANNLNVLGGSATTTSGVGDTITVTSTGIGSLSSFFATISAAIPNVIGDNAGYTVPFDTAVFDLNSDFNTGTGLFTAPHKGIYLFNSTVAMSPITVAMTNCSIKLVVNSGAPGDIELRARKINTVPVIDYSAALAEADITIFGYIELEQNDTVKVVVELDGGAGNTAGIFYGTAANDYRTWFQGSLIALT